MTRGLGVVCASSESTVVTTHDAAPFAKLAKFGPTMARYHDQHHESFNQ
jgi:hypothetical protein